MGEGSQVALPLPSHTFPVLPAPFCREEGGREGLVSPLAHPELQDSVRAGFLCLCHVPRRRGPRPLS